jgi:hypothetical protein
LIGLAHTCITFANNQTARQMRALTTCDHMQEPAESRHHMRAKYAEYTVMPHHTNVQGQCVRMRPQCTCVMHWMTDSCTYKMLLQCINGTSNGVQPGAPVGSSIVTNTPQPIAVSQAQLSCMCEAPRHAARNKGRQVLHQMAQQMH